MRLKKYHWIERTLNFGLKNQKN